MQPAHVTVINLLEAHYLDAPCVRSIEGDALRADEILADEEFDLVFSNSLIEHLGGHNAPADSLMWSPTWRRDTLYRRPTATLRWSRTRCFPVSSSFLCAHVRTSPRAGRSDTRMVGIGAPLRTKSWRPMLSVAEMREYFPSARISWERVAGVPKSMIAVR